MRDDLANEPIERMSIFTNQHPMIDRRFSDFLTWLAGGMIGGYLALRMPCAALVDGSYMPVGNDSLLSRLKNS